MGERESFMNILKSHWPTILAAVLGALVPALEKAGVVFPQWVDLIVAAIVTGAAGNVAHRTDWPSSPTPKADPVHITIPPKGNA